MPVGSTSHRSVQVLGFDEYGHLTPVRRLVSSSCSSGQRFAIGLPSDSQSPAKPLPLANSSPCRASRGLSPPSRCALPGAPKKRHRDHRCLVSLLFLLLLYCCPVKAVSWVFPLQRASNPPTTEAHCTRDDRSATSGLTLCPRGRRLPRSIAQPFPQSSGPVNWCCRW